LPPPKDTRRQHGDRHRGVGSRGAGSDRHTGEKPAV
jgi:hypothetical protein